MTSHKYARPEWERRFLVNADSLVGVEETDEHRIYDRYLERGRLRLRKIEADGRPPIFKLAKKYGSDDPLVEPIANLYLSEAEYDALLVVPGREIRKRRTRVLVNGVVLGIDRFEGELSGLILAEVERESREALLTLAMPEWATREVSRDPFFRGGNLCRLTAGELAEWIAEMER